jgi:hypothetical protein
MGITINWLPPTNATVGSVLIYKATDTQAEALGSRTILTTIDAKSGGEWVTSYTDTGGNIDNLYRIQFWDGVGSSEFSDVVGEQFDELLCTFEDVRRIANLQNKDVGSEEIYYAIKDATDEAFFSAGDPIKQSVIYVDSLTGTAGEVYNFNGDWGPIYQAREVYINDGATSFIIKSTDYDIDYANGDVKFTDAFIGSYQGRNVYINWVPTTYHLLIKNVAALDLIEAQNVFVGRDVVPPYVDKLKRKVDELKETIRPKGLYSTKSENILTDYDVVGQHSDRTFLYFNH